MKIEAVDQDAHGGIVQQKDRRDKPGQDLTEGGRSADRRPPLWAREGPAALPLPSATVFGAPETVENHT